VMWVAIVNTVIGFVLYYESMKHIEASLVQIVLNLIAVWGVLMSIFILQETVTLLQILGGVVTVIGVVIAQMAQKRRESNVEML
jgi:drug/metabolite transporter (DMT)-like permease